MKRIQSREKYCLACRLCEIGCLVVHSKSKNVISAFRNERATVVPAMRVEESGGVSFAVQCRHCTDAPCLEACISGALTRDARTGAVVFDQMRCVGCWSCIMVCPAGAIARGADRKVASKCDLCVGVGRETPACVECCPNGALIYE